MRRNSHNPRGGIVGILAKTTAQAASLAREFNIMAPVPISPLSLRGLRGNSLTVLLVDDDMWPVPEKLMKEISPTLVKYAAYVVRLERHDPRVTLAPREMAGRPWAR